MLEINNGKDPQQAAKRMDQREPRISRKLEKIKKRRNKIMELPKLDQKSSFEAPDSSASFAYKKRECAVRLRNVRRRRQTTILPWVWHPMGRGGGSNPRPAD